MANATLTYRTTGLDTARPFTISAGTRTRVVNVHTFIARGGLVGFGEAAPSKRVTGETVESTLESLAWAAKEVADAADLQALLPRLHSTLSERPSARAAVDLAIHDLLAKERGLRVRETFDIPRGRLAAGMTVSLASPEAMAEEARAYVAQGFGVLKVKLGDATLDRERARAVREAAPRARLTADANQGWTITQARTILPVLHDLGFELSEQPVAVSNEPDLVALSRESAIPIYADESIKDARDVARLAKAGFRGGATFKLQKTGGLLPAVEAVKVARESGLGVMMGCNLETGCGIAAGAQFLGVCAHADLDGNLLLRTDPFEGAGARAGWLESPDGVGLGVRPRPDFPRAWPDS